MTDVSVPEELDLEALEHWFGEVLDQYYAGSELLDLLMIASDNRENCLVSVYSKEQEEKLVEFCEYYDLNYRIENAKSIFSRINDISRKIKGQKIYTQKQIWISNNNVPRFTFHWSQKKIGRFLDYPESAIEAFKHDEMAEKMSEYVSFRPAKNDIEPLLVEEHRRIELLKKLDEEGLKFPSRWLAEFDSYSNASS